MRYDNIEIVNQVTNLGTTNEDDVWSGYLAKGKTSHVACTSKTTAVHQINIVETPPNKNTSTSRNFPKREYIPV